MLEENYGIYNSWPAVTKAFGQLIEKLPPDKPIRMWPIACAIIGEENQYHARTLIKQFLNLGAIDNASNPKETFQSREYFVNAKIIEEFMLD